MQTYCVPLNSKQINAFFGYEEFWNYSYIWCPLGYMIAFEFFFHRIHSFSCSIVPCSHILSWKVETRPEKNNECTEQFQSRSTTYECTLHNLDTISNRNGITEVKAHLAGNRDTIK